MTQFLHLRSNYYRRQSNKLTGTKDRERPSLKELRLPAQLASQQAGLFYRLLNRICLTMLKYQRISLHPTQIVGKGKSPKKQLRLAPKKGVNDE